MILSAQSIWQRKPIKDMRERFSAHGLSGGLSPAGYDICVAEDLSIPPGGFALASSCEEFDMPDDLLGIVHDKSTWARRGLCVQNTVIEPGWCGYLTLELTNHCEFDWVACFKEMANHRLLISSKLERDWEQYIRDAMQRAGKDKTIELKSGMPIAQIIFHVLDAPTEKPYNGKYQNQEKGAQAAR